MSGAEVIDFKTGIATSVAADEREEETTEFPVDYALVERLEYLLAEAEEGRLTGLATITLTLERDGDIITHGIGTGWAGHGVHHGRYAFLAGATLLQKRLADDLFQDAL
jgi:hypothetical protein